jgi:hypothetical protein
MIDRAKLPDAKSWYERELGELARPDRKGWARVRRGCPFHPSKSKKSFFVNVQHGGYRCFGCDAGGGDMIAFVMKFHHQDFRGALKLMGVRDDFTPTPKKKIVMSTDRYVCRLLAIAAVQGKEANVNADAAWWR